MTDNRYTQILRALHRIERKIEYFLGTYSRYIGQAAEIITQRIIEMTSKGGLKVNHIFLPPLKIIQTNLKTKNYEIDILAKDPQGEYWIIESTTYPILHQKQIEKIYRRVLRWSKENNTAPNFILFAYGGIDHGLYLQLSSKLNDITKKHFIVDKVLAEKFLSLVRTRNS